MEPTQKSGFELLIDEYGEKPLIEVMARTLCNLHDCSDMLRSDIAKFEMLLKRFLKRVDKPEPTTDWPSDFA